MIKLEDTRSGIAAAEKQAKQISQPMNIVLADEGGNLISPSLWMARGGAVLIFPSKRHSTSRSRHPSQTTRPEAIPTSIRSSEEVHARSARTDQEDSVTIRHREPRLFEGGAPTHRIQHTLRKSQ
jgi:hypothetical protein